MLHKSYACTDKRNDVSISQWKLLPNTFSDKCMAIYYTSTDRNSEIFSDNSVGSVSDVFEFCNNFNFSSKISLLKIFLIQPK